MPRIHFFIHRLCEDDGWFIRVTRFSCDGNILNVQVNTQMSDLVGHACTHIGRHVVVIVRIEHKNIIFPIVVLNCFWNFARQFIAHDIKSLTFRGITRACYLSCYKYTD